MTAAKIMCLMELWYEILSPIIYLPPAGGLLKEVCMHIVTTVVNLKKENSHGPDVVWIISMVQ